MPCSDGIFHHCPAHSQDHLTGCGCDKLACNSPVWKRDFSTSGGMATTQLKIPARPPAKRIRGTLRSRTLWQDWKGVGGKKEDNKRVKGKRLRKNKPKQHHLPPPITTTKPKHQHNPSSLCTYRGENEETYFKYSLLGSLDPRLESENSEHSFHLSVNPRTNQLSSQVSFFPFKLL